MKPSRRPRATWQRDVTRHTLRRSMHHLSTATYCSPRCCNRAQLPRSHLSGSRSVCNCLTLRYKGIRHPPILDTFLDKSNTNLKIAHNNTMTIVDCYVPAGQTMSKFMGCPPGMIKINRARFSPSNQRTTVDWPTTITSLMMVNCKTKEQNVTVFFCSPTARM
jgi:hypothetical protein